MPKSYSEKERASIKEELRKAAFETMLQKGVQKTTVDELVTRVHIPKGTFYLLYPSKEMLLYDAFVDIHEQIHDELGRQLMALSGSFTRETLSELIFGFFQLGFSTGVLKLMLNGELDVLMRKLPDDVVRGHIEEDDDYLSIFKLFLPSISDETLRKYSAAFRAVFFTAVYKREIGKYFDEALRLLINGLLLQMWEEPKEEKND